MSLEKYKEKRDFSRSPEPSGGEAPSEGRLRFVVQKHKSSHLHYDLRLELQGVLKSWAIPKGPSLNPHEKRLAMMVEDHPLDYRTFEGVIPEGEYGAGSVMVWDEGDYCIPDSCSPEDMEESISKALTKGHFAFVLNGTKLRGRFVLAHMQRTKEENAWLFFKVADEDASDDDILKDDRSALSGRAMDEIASDASTAGEVWVSAESLEGEIGGHRLKLTNLDKIFWPEDGYTKGDLISYYRDIAPFILPYLKDRPESLNRHPDGIHGESFYQKNVDSGMIPEWMPTVKIPSDDERGYVNYLLCQEEAALVFLANLACIELNPWNSRADRPDRPDFAIMDLDPEGVSFGEVVEAAQAVHHILESAGVESCPKTSGATGLHIYIPLGAKYTYDQARDFVKIIAHLANQNLPETTSVERHPAKRQGRVYLDYLQNSRGQTLAAAYCVRPRPGATVSTPLKWEEVRAGLDPKRFTIRTIRKRLDKVGDLFTPVLGPGIDLAQALERLGS